MFGEYLGITENDQPVLGSGQSHIESPGIIQETNTRSFVTPDTRKENEILLSSLEAVDRGHLDFFVELRVQLTVPLHVIHDEGSLSLIGRDDADLLGS